MKPPAFAHAPPPPAPSHSYLLRSSRLLAERGKISVHHGGNIGVSLTRAARSLSCRYTPPRSKASSIGYQHYNLLPNARPLCGFSKLPPPLQALGQDPPAQPRGRLAPCRPARNDLPRRHGSDQRPLQGAAEIGARLAKQVAAWQWLARASCGQRRRGNPGGCGRWRRRPRRGRGARVDPELWQCRGSRRVVVRQRAPERWPAAARGRWRIRCCS